MIYARLVDKSGRILNQDQVPYIKPGQKMYIQVCLKPIEVGHHYA